MEKLSRVAARTAICCLLIGSVQAATPTYTDELPEDVSMAPAVMRIEVGDPDRPAWVPQATEKSEPVAVEKREPMSVEPAQSADAGTKPDVSSSSIVGSAVITALVTIGIDLVVCAATSGVVCPIPLP
jgi:hypothetical protein